MNHLPLLPLPIAAPEPSYPPGLSDSRWRLNVGSKPTKAEGATAETVVSMIKFLSGDTFGTRPIYVVDGANIFRWRADLQTWNYTTRIDELNKKKNPDGTYGPDWKPSYEWRLPAELMPEAMLIRARGPTVVKGDVLIVTSTDTLNHNLNPTKGVPYGDPGVKNGPKVAEVLSTFLIEGDGRVWVLEVTPDKCSAVAALKKDDLPNEMSDVPWPITDVPCFVRFKRPAYGTKVPGTREFAKQLCVLALTGRTTRPDHKFCEYDDVYAVLVANAIRNEFLKKADTEGVPMQKIKILSMENSLEEEFLKNTTLESLRRKYKDEIEAFELLANANKLTFNVHEWDSTGFVGAGFQYVPPDVVVKDIESAKEDLRLEQEANAKAAEKAAKERAEGWEEVPRHANKRGSGRPGQPRRGVFAGTKK